MTLNVKHVPRRHVCSVNGCRNRNAMLITRSADYTRGIWLCADCIRDAYAAVAQVPAATEKETEEETAMEDVMLSVEDDVKTEEEAECGEVQEKEEKPLAISSDTASGTEVIVQRKRRAK
jgi:hypothetical protein